MTTTLFKRLCKDDYEKQLQFSGYNQEEIDTRMQEESALFDRAEMIMTEGGGCLTLVRGKTAYLFYILVFEEHRNKRIGEALLKLFEVKMRSRGITKIQLNVFNGNHIAKKLYKEYKPISTLMEKSL